MFGALNRLISRLDEAPQKSQTSAGDNPYGFQVLRNPTPELPLEPWFDFIIGINGHVIVSVLYPLCTTYADGCYCRTTRVSS